MDFSRARDGGPAWEPTADKVLGLDQLADLGPKSAGSPGPATPADDDLQDLGDLTYAQLVQARGLDPAAADLLAELRLPRPSRAPETGPHLSVGPASTALAPDPRRPAGVPAGPAVGSRVPAAAPAVPGSAPRAPAPAPAVPASVASVPAAFPPSAELPTWPPPGVVPGASGDPATHPVGPAGSEPPPRSRWRWSKRSAG